MKYVLFCLLACSFHHVSAQPTVFAPAGAEWFYSYNTGLTGFQGFAHAQSLGDTLIDGLHCQQICLAYYLQPSEPPYCSPETSRRYLYQEADSIFEYIPGAPLGELRLLFRTNFQLGDSFPFLFRTYIVTAIDTLDFNGQPVRRFHLTNEVGDMPIVYDRFGPEEGLFNYSWGLIADGTRLRLRCYEEPGFPQIHISEEACDFIVSTGEPTFSVRIYPNPVQETLRLEFTGIVYGVKQIEIWDAVGRLVQEQQLAADRPFVDVKTLRAGFYELVVRTGAGIVQQKFVKN